MTTTEKLQTIAENEQKVYEAGKEAEYERFWETYLANIYDGMYAFSGWGWRDETFNPPRGTVFRPTYAHSMFSHTKITDFVKLCDEKGIIIDFSKSATMTQTFYTPNNGQILRIGVVDTTSSASLAQTFRGQGKLHTIVLLKLKEDGSQGFNTTFTGCKALVHLEIEGTIGQNGFDVSASSLLDYESLTSIKIALADKSADTSGTTWIITVGNENKAKYTEEDKDEILQKGWVLK
jgi:hypothetical protein